MMTRMPEVGRSAPATPRYCLGCSHSLEGLTEPVCPECGRRFDPCDARTTGECPFPRRRSATQLARALVLLGGLALAVEILLSAWGGSHILPWLIGLSIAPVMIAGFVLALVPALLWSWRWRLVGIATPLLLAGVLFTDWPFRMLFEAHRTRFDAAVAEIETGGAPPDGSVQVGLYPILAVKRTPGGNLGFQLSGHAGGGVFLVHRSPNGRDLWVNTDLAKDLGGGWWWVHAD